jgi:hypothetical protein
LLIDHFHLPIDKIARLTPRQMCELYGHERESGAIKMPEESVNGRTPEEPPSYEQSLIQIQAAGFALKMSPEEIAKAEKKLAEKYGRQPSNQ